MASVSIAPETEAGADYGDMPSKSQVPNDLPVDLKSEYPR